MNLKWKMIGCAALLAGLATGCSSTGPTSPGYAARDSSGRLVIDDNSYEQARNWNRMNRGMTPWQVQNELGEPIRVKQEGAIENWYYTDGAVVYFDSNRRVIGWLSPTFAEFHRPSPQGLRATRTYYAEEYPATTTTRTYHESRLTEYNDGKY